ncbi:hypothetical protein HPB49_009537 [Dermacentor silvarum]|uniref:Uncharacterized protein n=1 Tax=Dermacentor silvarum TaxID=543639 RepID=A0ACB8DIX3_DERSI|nr:hypothetical protein HPB49_009537 [Dermacentor silvarum]
MAASQSPTAGASPAAGPNATGRSGIMDEEAAMVMLQDRLEEKNLTPVHVVRRHVSPQTIILRLGTKLNLAKYPTYQVTNAIGVDAGLTASEETQKLAGLRSVTLDGERHDVTAYVAAEARHAGCVVHGLPKDIPDDQLLSIISVEDRQILAAQRLGQSETILLTVKGAMVPKEVKMGLWLTKTQPFRPRAVQCTICFIIGHRADVCPTAHEFTRCETCGQQFPPAQRPDRTAHECEVRCFKCEGPHGARDPRCPKKQQADKVTRLAAERRSTTQDHNKELRSAPKPPNKPKNSNHSTTALKLYEIRHGTQNRSPDPDLAVCQATQRKDRRHPRHHPSRKLQVLCGPWSPGSHPRIPKSPRTSNPGTYLQPR